MDPDLEAMAPGSGSGSCEGPATGTRTHGKRLLWFVLLWLGGVAATFLVTLPFKLLVHAVTH
ncbi:protein of unknown function [Pararobbsia alpina]|uniref:hypothetical protein n=1 Tax=Pararobbsia alpina TaxID=621374 RepID=UPI0039A5E804